MTDNSDIPDRAVSPPGAVPAYERRNWPRRLLRPVLAVVVLLAVLAAGGFVLARHYEGELRRTSLAAPATHRMGPATARRQKTPSSNYLLVGSDTRAGKDGAFGSADTSGQRSDTVILAHLPAGATRPTLLSFPRDAYVLIPSHKTPRGTLRPAHYDKLNAAFALGGPGLLIATIESITGAHVDHYVEVDFVGLERMVDALGGVTLCAKTTRNDPANGPMGGSDDFMIAGVHPDVPGRVALAFVRDRHDVPGGDLGRIQDQQYFLSQVTKKVLNLGTLVNPLTLNKFLNALAMSLTVDADLSLSNIRDLATRLRHTDPAHLRFVTVPILTSNGSEIINGVPSSVVLLDPVADIAVYTDVFGAAPGAPAADGRNAQGRLPAGLRLQVVNTTRRNGLAQQVGRGLSAAGASSVTTLTGTGAPLLRTTVVYPVGQYVAAGAVARLLRPEALLQPSASATTLRVLIGTDFLGVRSLAPGAPPPPPAARAPADATSAQLSCGA